MRRQSLKDPTGWAPVILINKLRFNWRPPGPIFILGSGRSGTTLLRNAIAAATALPGYGEGHFLQSHHHLSLAIDAFLKSPATRTGHEKHMVGQLSRDDFSDGLAAMLRQIYVQHFGSERFIDKTPGLRAIQATPLILRAFPNARIVYATRRGLEVVRSMMQKFPETEFERHCFLWSANMSEIDHNLRTGDTRVAHFDLRRIADNPHGMALALADHLGLRTRHADVMERVFIQHRPQASIRSPVLPEETAAPTKVPLSIDSTGWSDAAKAIFMRSCAEQMEAWGYSTGPSYWR